MKKSRKMFVSLTWLVVLAGLIFLGCTVEVKPTGSDDCEKYGTCQGESSSGGIDNPSYSSNTNTSSNSNVIPSSNSNSSSSITITDPGANCAYKPIWCKGIPFSEVDTGSKTGSVGNDDQVPIASPICVFATSIASMGNNYMALEPNLVNGIELKGQSGNSVNGRCGSPNGWGQVTCEQALATANVQKADGGYYIYIDKWAGDFNTIGGTPVCTGTGGGNPNVSSSSSGGGTSTGGTGAPGNCANPQYGVPPYGTGSCVKVVDKDNGNTKCYTCNQDRGTECNQGWIFQVGNAADQYWFTEVSCGTSGGTSSSSSVPATNLVCSGMPATGIVGTSINRPTITCNGATVSNTSGVTFTGGPTSWSNPPSAGTFNVSVTATTGTCNGKMATCGTLVISAATANNLTCTGLASTGKAGTAITQPTVLCGTSSTSATFTGAPTWSNPNAGVYSVTASASCGGSTKTATCGSISVYQLTCGAVPTTGTSGTAITAPTVSCGTGSTSSAVTSGITWTYGSTNALSGPNWNNPAAGSYSSIRATAGSGNCSGLSATCSGTLTVTAPSSSSSSPNLTCATVSQSITVGQTPTKPAVACGSTNLTSGITWSPTSINGAITTAQTITGVTVSASSGDCSGKTASCPGTITVTAAPSSSSASGGGVTNDCGSACDDTVSGGSGFTTRYWDSCKPSCAWAANASQSTNGAAMTCNVSGSKLTGQNDKNACESGGTGYTCANQFPWAINDNLAYGFAASHTNGDCGKCYLLQFTDNGEGGNSATIIGKKMVVMISNIGGDVSGTQFDLMIPGGGVGMYNAFSSQLKSNGFSGEPSLGQQYGGFRATCGNNVSCIRDMCTAAFGSNSSGVRGDFMKGCQWYIDWFKISNNPKFNSKQITCPPSLVAKYKH